MLGCVAVKTANGHQEASDNLNVLKLLPQQTQNEVVRLAAAGTKREDDTVCDMQDWSATEFSELLQSMRDHCTHHDELAEQCSNLLRQLDVLWEEQYAHCCTACVGVTSSGMLTACKWHMC